MSQVDVSGTLPPRRPVTDSVTAPHRLAMGLAALAPGESWLELDADLGADLREKQRLFSKRRDDVFVELAESRDAQREVLRVVVDAVTSRYPELYALDSGTLQVRATGEALDLERRDVPPLESAARCVQEDLVVMEKRPDGWCLTAAAVCFPTRWQLRPQLGRPLSAIHERVPGYREEIDHSAIRFFDRMKGSTVYRRGNWSLMDDPTLFQPTVQPSVDFAGRDAGERIFLRVEHQTLQRLKDTGAILFGIRIHRTRLDAVACDPHAARALLGAIETMAPEMQRYKSLALVRDAAKGYLEEVLRTPARR